MKSAGKLLTGRGTRSVENVHHLRMMALLRDLVRDMGTMQAAEALGVDRKTVWRGMSAGRLSPRLADAMERLLLEQGVADSARQLERIEVLEGRVEKVAGDVNALREEMREEIEAVRGGDRRARGSGCSRSVETRWPVGRAGCAEAEDNGRRCTRGASEDETASHYDRRQA